METSKIFDKLFLIYVKNKAEDNVCIGFSYIQDIFYAKNQVKNIFTACFLHPKHN